MVKEIRTGDGRIIAYCPECDPVELEYNYVTQSWYCDSCGFIQKSYLDEVDI